MTSPIYEHIEFCRSPKALWGKLKSGRWDWLGVKPDGVFVLGTPRRVRSREIGAVLQHKGAAPGKHGVVIETPNGGPSPTWTATPDFARQEYRESLVSLRGSGESPVLYRISRVESGHVVDEEFVVSRPSTYR
jgi:hypothetical protein